LEEYNKKKKKMLKLNENEVLEVFSSFHKNLNISVNDIGNLGDYVLNAFAEVSDLLETQIIFTNKSGGPKSERLIKPTPKCIQLVEKSFDVIGFTIPMIYEPNK
jgi:hypothetical protein